MAAAPGYRRSWIFRDVTVAPGTYPVRQYRDLIHQGDIVYLWSASSSELHAWGAVTTDPYALDEPRASAKQSAPTQQADPGQVEPGAPPASTGDDPDTADATPSQAFVVQLDTLGALSPAFTNEELARDPELIALTLLRSPSGTNFRVTTLEALRLNERIREQGGEAPPDPDGTVNGAFPPLALSAYRFSSTPTRIFATAFDLMSRSAAVLEPAELAALCLEFVATYTDRTGISRYLRGALGEDPLAYVSGLRHLSGIETLRAHTGPLPWKETGEFELASTRLSTATLRTVERARRLALATTKREQIRFRHLFAALLIVEGEDTGARDRLSWSGLEPEALAEPFLEFVGKEFEDDQTAWRQVLRPGGLAGTAAGASDASGALTAASAAEVLADLLVPFLSDRPEGNDLLGITAEYRAFAKLIAGRDGTSERLPMAIGLFGHWGAGKSFFMGKLREEITALSAITQPSYCDHIAQIEFNAWHYMEADIWASFADHIFRELERPTRGNDDEQERFENLLDQLDTWSALKASATRKLEVADQRLTTAREKVEDVKQQATDAEARAGTLGKQLLAVLDGGALFERLGQVLGSAAEQFELERLLAAKRALDTTAGNLAGALRVAEETRGLEREVVELAGSFRLVPWLRERWSWIAGLTVCSALVWFALHPWSDQAAAAAATLAQIAGLFGTGVAWMQDKLGRARAFTAELAQLRADLTARAEAALQQASEEESSQATAVRTQLDEARAELERLEAERKGLEQEQADAAQKVSDLQAELVSATPAERIVQFIRERASTEDYRERLGTLALVRRDFEHLAELLRDQRNGVRMTDREGKVLRLPEVDRVVLYIDDLDRVPWPTVVEVLQAVHLLLAFDLFVVVVAVDARWVKKSVESHLRALSRENGNGNGASRTGAEDADGAEHPDEFISPEEFLEKIIQVPFWLRGLTGDSTTALIEGLLRRDVAGAGEEGEEGQAGAESDEGLTPRRPTIAHIAGVVGSLGANLHALNVNPGSGVEIATGAAPGASLAERPLGKFAKEQVSERLNRPAVPPPGESEPLNAPEVRQAEIEFMKVLAPIIGRTPRVVKRFVNLYLILRAFRPETGSDEFVSETGAYRAVLLLLAFLTGRAKYAGSVFSYLESGAEVDTLGEWIQGSEGQPPRVRLAADAEHIQRLLRDLVAVGHGDIRTEHLNAWMLYVSRFGFERPAFLS